MIEEREKVMKLLKGAFLLYSGSSESDLLTDNNYNYKEVVDSKKILKFIKDLK